MTEQSPQDPNATPILRKTLSLAASTLLGMAALALLPFDLPWSTLGFALGLLWAVIAGGRGPFHIATPTALVLLVAIAGADRGLDRVWPGTDPQIYSTYAALLLAAVVMPVVRARTFAAETVELRRLAGTRRPLSDDEYHPPPTLDLEVRTPPPTRLVFHLLGGALGSALGAGAFWLSGRNLATEVLVLAAVITVLVALGIASPIAPVLAGVVIAVLQIFAPTLGDLWLGLGPVLVMSGLAIGSAGSAGKASARATSLP